MGGNVKINVNVIVNVITKNINVIAIVIVNVVHELNLLPVYCIWKCTVKNLECMRYAFNPMQQELTCVKWMDYIV